MRLGNAGMILAVVLLGGCATKQEVNTLHGDVGMIQQEWQAFQAGYDPATREELRKNLALLKEQNAEIALLRDESRRNADRVAELLREIDNNLLDQAVVECRRNSTDAAQFAGMAQQNAETALGYAEEMRQMTHRAIRQHEQEAHRVDTAELIAKLRGLEKRIQKLERELRQQKDGEGREERPERSGR